MVTDEQLQDWERLAKEPWIDVGVRLPVVVDLLIQEVRRLREELRTRVGTAASSIPLTFTSERERAEKAEAALVVHAKEWTEATELWMKQVKNLEAERDWYAQALGDIVHLAKDPHLQIARAAEIARVALDQQEGGES